MPLDEEGRLKLFDELAKANGCSDGKCGYDFDEECYWWLQDKVEIEAAKRDAKLHTSFGPGTSSFTNRDGLRRKSRSIFEEVKRASEMSPTEYSEYLKNMRDLEIDEQFNREMLRNATAWQNEGNILDDVQKAAAKWRLKDTREKRQAMFRGGPLDGQRRTVQGEQEYILVAISEPLRWDVGMSKYPPEAAQHRTERYGLTHEDEYGNLYYTYMGA